MCPIPQYKVKRPGGGDTGEEEGAEKHGDSQCPLGTKLSSQFVSQYLQDVPRQIIKMFMEEHYLPAIEEKLADHPELKPVFKGVYEQMFTDQGLDVCASNAAKARVEDKVQKDEIYFMEITHECRSQACKDPLCRLCRSNPKKKCGEMMLQDKYVMGKGLLTKCGQPLMIVLKRKSTGELVRVDGEVVVTLLDGQKYDTCFQGQQPTCSMSFDPCMVHEERAQLDCSPSMSCHKQPDGIHILMKDGIVQLPKDLNTPASTFAHFRYKAATYRLLVRGVSGSGSMPPVHHIQVGISQSFVSLTPRAMLTQKTERPLFTDDIKKLERMGKERTNKFKALKDYVHRMDLPDSIATVGDFKRCSQIINSNGRLRAEVLSALHISGEDWHVMCEHSDQALEHDMLMRSWRCGKDAYPIALLIYACNNGEVNLQSGPVAVLSGGEVVSRNDWQSWQTFTIEKLHNLAKKAWWEYQHPGWEVLPWDEEHFAEGLISLTETDLKKEDATSGMSASKEDCCTPIAKDGCSALSRSDPQHPPDAGEMEGVEEEEDHSHPMSSGLDNNHGLMTSYMDLPATDGMEIPTHISMPLINGIDFTQQGSLRSQDPASKMAFCGAYDPADLVTPTWSQPAFDLVPNMTFTSQEHLGLPSVGSGAPWPTVTSMQPESSVLWPQPEMFEDMMSVSPPIDPCDTLQSLPMTTLMESMEPLDSLDLADALEYLGGGAELPK